MTKDENIANQKAGGFRLWLWVTAGIEIVKRGLKPAPYLLIKWRTKEMGWYSEWRVQKADREADEKIAEEAARKKAEEANKG